MTLKNDIDKMQEGLLPQIPTEALDLFGSTTEKLVQSGIAGTSLKKGDKAPTFALPSITGKIIDSAALLKNGPLVVSFYRGQWCPYCDLELRALQAALVEIQNLGAQLVAISPQTPEHSKSTSENRSLQFEVLNDTNNEVARTFGLVFTLDNELQTLYPNLGINLSASNGNNSGELPMPAIYVIAPDGTIAYSYVNADYTQRAEPIDIVTVLNNMQG